MDQKVLTALMMIEKDYLKKFRFNVLIARPKKLFTKVYARVTDEDAIIIIKKYGKSIQPVSYSLLDNRGYKILNIDLDRIWKNNFADKSFPRIKYDFYNNILFKDITTTIMPQLKISFVLNTSVKEVSSKLTNNFNKINNAFASMGTNHFYSQDEVISQLDSKLNDKYLSMKIGMFVLSNYSETYSNNNIINNNGFLAKRKNLPDETYKYRIINILYIREFSNLITKFNQLFINNITGESSRYVSNKSNTTLDFTRLGYFLELFELGTFEIKGGENPMIFIRINDANRIEKDTKEWYSNLLLEKTLNRHSLSNHIFDHFFLNSFTNDDRWNFIEDFFLGTDIDDLIDKYPRNEIIPKVDIINYLKKNVTPPVIPTKSLLNTNSVFKLPPDNKIYYDLKTMLTIGEDNNSKTLRVSQWLEEDIIKFDSIRKENNLKISKDVFIILVSKLRANHYEYFRDRLGLNHRIEFDGYKGLIKASIPYKDHPIEFYKWWLKDKTAVNMSFEEKLILFSTVNSIDKNILQVKDRNILNKK